MPEGPEVKCIGDNISTTIGKVITSMGHSTNPKHKWSLGIHGWNLISPKWIPSEFRYHCAWIIDNIVVKGKLLRINLTSGLQKYAILSTLGLEGHWRIDSPSKKHDRVWFHFSDGSCLVYSDSRNFGTIKIVTYGEADKKMDQIGWDLLQNPMELNTWNMLQSKKRLQNQFIAVALLEQKYFSGIGNIYKSEILYELGINPNCLVGNLNPKVWESINYVAHGILQTAYLMKGSSVKSYLGGNFQTVLKIYNKSNCPKGHVTSIVKHKGRTTWFCPICQP